MKTNKNITAQITFFIRTILGFLFIISGISKIVDIHTFAGILKNFHIVSSSIADVLSIILPVCEFLMGLALVIGFYVRYIAISLSVIITSFIIFLIFHLSSYTSLQCGCFGVLEEGDINNIAIYRDIFLLSLSLILVFMSFKENKMEVNNYHTENPIKLVLKYMFCVVCSILIIKVNALLEISQNITGNIANKKEFNQSNNNKSVWEKKLIKEGTTAPLFIGKNLENDKEEWKPGTNYELFLFMNSNIIKRPNIAAFMQYVEVLKRHLVNNDFNVTCIYHGNKSIIKQFFKKYYLDFQIFVDSSLSIYKLYGVPKGYIAIILVNKRGIISYNWLGFPNQTELRNLVEKVVLGKSKVFVDNGSDLIDVGDRFPNIEIINVMNNKKYKFYDLQNQYAIVAYFTSNCGCKNELHGEELLSSLADDLKNNNKIEFIPIYGTKYSTDELLKRKSIRKLHSQIYSTTSLYYINYYPEKVINPPFLLINNKHKVSLKINIWDNKSVIMNKILSYNKAQLLKNM